MYRRIFTTFLLTIAMNTSYSQSSQKLIPYNDICDQIAETTNQTEQLWLVFNKSPLSAANLFADHASLFGLESTDKMELVKQWTDQLGTTHYRYQQTYKGLPVDAAIFTLHETNGILRKGNGYLVSNIQLDVKPAMDEGIAIQKIMQHINASTYAWEDPGAEAMLQRIKDDLDASFYPIPELVVLQSGGDQRLTYKLNVYALQPLSRKNYYIEANSGEVIREIEQLHTGDVVGTAETKYAGTQTIITDSVSPTMFRLREEGRGGGIETYDMNEGTIYGNAVDFTDTDNYWNNVNAEQDEVATDAHWGAEMTYDYYLQMHNRDSYDNAGAKLTSYIHYDVAYNNAFWNGTWMSYGDGAGATTALASLDVAGHEITHGVTQTTANLVYQNESGALNESFSDIFGTAIEFWADPANGDWLIGEDAGPAFRSLSNPKTFNDPDTYDGQNWYGGTADNGGVHTNSGVQNYWFYLLSEGGNGTNDNNDPYNIAGLGIDTAAAIAYRNLEVYLTNNSTYFDARQGALQAAEDLYGACSDALLQTASAWYAVGVGNPIADNDIWVISVESPQTGCYLTNSELVSGRFRYNGCANPLNIGDSIPMALRVNNLPVVRDTIVLVNQVNGGDSLTFTFSTPVDFSTVGIYEIDIWSEFADDTENYNDTLLDVVVERKIQQNTDFALVTIVSPGTGCSLTSDETVEVNVIFLGCDSVNAGETLEMGYSIDGGTPVTENYTLPNKILSDGEFLFSFNAKANLSGKGVYDIDAWATYALDNNNVNDIVTNYKVKNPHRINDRVVTFEDTTGNVIDSLVISTNPESDAFVSSDAANTGENGLQMTGGDVLNYTGELIIPTPLNIWLVNDDFSAMVCFCAASPSPIARRAMAHQPLACVNV